ncbi:hypothetical protein [Marinobacter sp.]|uniref:hypothetical protein n=1 Tax=Marinobacter sp. TaxID=50741 RepID=UPI000C8A6FB7|nr:hypothetical protein [Marinobacter sp.]MAB50951.1 hypothetical protein [Marinobacter sp.]
MTDEQITRMLERYKKGLEIKKQQYHDVKKHDPEFVARNRERARLHYENNKEKKKQNYEKNKERNKLLNLFNYYKKKDMLDKLQDKYPEKYKQLQDMGKIES